MEFIIRFMVNLFDLGIFWYYFHCFKQMKKVPKGLFAAYLVTMAAIWAAVSGLENLTCYTYVVTGVANKI